MKNNELVIRPFVAATDLERLSDIWFAASLAAHPFIGRDILSAQRQLIEEEYLPKAETWVACHDGPDQDPIGFISLLGSFVGGIFISPDRQAMGAGRKLIAHALGRTGELTLEVYLENRQALGFYNALGFQEVSRREEDDSGYPFPNATLSLKHLPDMG